MSATLDTATVNKFDAIHRDLTEMKVEMRGLRTSLDVLVAQERRRAGRPPAGKRSCGGTPGTLRPPCRPGRAVARYRGRSEKHGGSR
jgi:hypothetical protein